MSNPGKSYSFKCFRICFKVLVNIKLTNTILEKNLTTSLGPYYLENGSKVASLCFLELLVFFGIFAGV